MKNKQKLISKIKTETDTFFEKMGFPGKANAEFIEESSYCVSVKIDDPQVLIGKKGETLIMIQRLLGKVLRKKLNEDIKIDLDINDYKKRKISFLKELAQLTADEVSLNKKEKELDPMPAYERRIIHMALSERKDVSTESIGEEPNRRVIIRAS